MKFTVSSSALNSQLQTLAKVINSKNTLAILDSFLFEVKDNTLYLTASDNENIIKSSLALDACDADGKFTIVHRTILDVLKELPEQPLEFNIDLDSLNAEVVYQNGKYNFTLQNGTDYPEPPVLEPSATVISIASDVLCNNISRSVFAIGQDAMRPIMSSIYFDLTTESLSIVASDGHKLVRNQVLTVKGEKEASFMLPKKPALLLKNVLKKDDSLVSITFDGKYAELKFADGVLISRLIEGRYPKYNSVIPQENPNHLTIDRALLLGALRRVTPFASESTQLVRLHLESTAITLTAQDIDFARSAKETLTCDYNGASLDIGFKGTSLMEILSNMESEEVTFKIADPSRAGIIEPTVQPENENVLMLIMPMLLND